MARLKKIAATAPAPAPAINPALALAQNVSRWVKATHPKGCSAAVLARHLWASAEGVRPIMLDVERFGLGEIHRPIPGSWSRARLIAK